MLSIVEHAVIRAWIHGVPLSTYQHTIPPGATIHSYLTHLRRQLDLKARRLAAPWHPFFTHPREPSNSWERLAFTYLNWLQAHHDIEPSLNDPLQYWLDDRYLQPLHASSLNLILPKQALASVQEWLTWRHTQRNDWWRQLPGLGEIRAKQMERQLAEFFPDAVKVMHNTRTTPPCPVETTVLKGVSLETFLSISLENQVNDEDLDGSHGLYRNTGDCFIPANNDYQAIRCWLARFDATSHTYRAYQREAERLLLWAIVEKHKALSSLTTMDVADYRRFLQDPQPAKTWIGPKRPKATTHWKPFTGPLSARSLRHAETLLKHLFEFLLEQGYSRFNPYRSLPALRDPQGSARFDVHRALSHAQWTFLSEYLERQIEQANVQALPGWLRLRLIIKLLYATGLRLHELAQAKRGDLRLLEREEQRQCWLKVLGKGHQQREVPLPPKTYQLLQETHSRLTGRPWSSMQDEHPLIPPLRGTPRTPLTPKAIYNTLKAGFKAAAAELQQTDPESASILAQASTHWLRHTHGTHAVDRAIPLTVIRDNLGHSSIAVTSQYVHADKDKRHEAMLKME